MSGGSQLARVVRGSFLERSALLPRHAPPRHARPSPADVRRIPPRPGPRIAERLGDELAFKQLRKLPGVERVRGKVRRAVYAERQVVHIQPTRQRGAVLERQVSRGSWLGLGQARLSITPCGRESRRAVFSIVNFPSQSSSVRRDNHSYVRRAHDASRAGEQRLLGRCGAC